METSTEHFQEDSYLEGDIEYDDDVIFTENPHLGEHIKRFEGSQYQWCPLLEGAIIKRSSAGSVNADDHDILVQKTEEILETLREPISRIKAIEEEIREARTNIKEMKSNFSDLHFKTSKVVRLQEQVMRDIKTESNNIELIIYQNSVIKHLRTAAEYMKILQCYVSPDKKIYFCDPNLPDTDVDAAYMEYSQTDNAGEISDGDTKHFETVL